MGVELHQFLFDKIYASMMIGLADSWLMWLYLRSCR